MPKKMPNYQAQCEASDDAVWPSKRAEALHSGAVACRMHVRACSKSYGCKQNEG